MSCATRLLSRRAMLVGGAAALAACSGTSVRAPQNAVDRAVYRSGGPSALTLVTVKNTGSGNGAHSALVIDASQRVLFDPAGSFAHPTIPERDDVLFGFTPAAQSAYESYHARAEYYVLIQTLTVPDSTAELALHKALANGPVSRMFCTQATSSLIGQLPGFGRVGTTLFPNNLSDDFAKIDGVSTRTLREDHDTAKTIPISL